MKKGAGQFRLIGGQWRGRKLPILDSEGLRPTTDRVRETLFNWLQFDISDARVLDLFAGSGSLGFEAASRGATQTILVEKDKRVAKQLQQNIESLAATKSVQVLQADALSVLASPSVLPEALDIVFVDPPFGQGLAAKALDALSACPAISTESLVYLETEADLAVNYSGWSVVKEKQHGNVRFQLLQRDEPIKE